MTDFGAPAEVFGRNAAIRPQAMEIAGKLRSAGFGIRGTVLTADQLAEALFKLLSEA